jgi:hypothetical protein
MHDLHLAEYFALKDDDLPQNAFSCALQTEYRLFESNLQNVSSRFTKKTVFPLKSFRGGGKRCNLIYHREKIVGLTMLQHCIVPRYDTILSLSGKTRTEKTLRHSFGGQMDAIAHTTCARKEPKKRCFYNYKA